MAAPYVFIVCCRDEAHTIFTWTAVQQPTYQTFIDLFREASIYNKVELSPDNILYANASTNPSVTNPIKIPNLELHVQFAVDIQLRYIEFVLNSERLPSPSNVTTKTNNAFSVLLNAQKRISLPPKPENLNKKLTGPQQLLCNLIDWGEQLGSGWTQDSLNSGKRVFDKLTSALWYVDHCHDKFKQNGCPIPDCFNEFQGYNHYKELRHKVPDVTAKKLHEITEDLVAIVSLPSMSTARNKALTLNIESLISVFSKYNKRLSDDNHRHKHKYQKRDEVNDGDSHCSLISPDGSLEDTYKPLDKVLQEVGDYQYVDLDNYSPADKIERRKFLKGLKLKMPIMLYRVAYGGSVGTLNFVWSVPEGDRSDRNFDVIKTLSNKLPKFSSRLMRKEFIEQYVNFVKCPKSVLRHMYFNLTGCEETAESSDQHNIDIRVARKIMNADDPTLLLDLRASNGSESYFDEFFSEMGKYFDEMLLQVHERRHGDELYMPLAISLESLKDAIVKRLPEGTKIPSTETIRLQFSPCNPFEKTALKYTSRFDVKFRVQTRQARVDHIDAHYAAKYFQHLKEFCVLHRDHTIFVCMDDKAIIPVGEPGIPISTGVRGHNKVLAPCEGPKLVCTDHDFHIGGLVPSVALVCDIPENPKDSFFSGDIFVTTKDKVFSPSSPQRHTTELISILRQNFSTNDVDLSKPILCIMTDGGPDHRLTYETVKASLVLLFMHLDLDMLVALRTAPSHSWTNPAERCMSILNLALQHVALDRSEMSPQFEKMVKNKSTLSSIRNAATIYDGLQKAFEASMNDVVQKVNKRFAMMSLKGNKITSLQGAGITDIQNTLDLFKQVGLTTSEEAFTPSTKSKDLKKMKSLQSFLEKHTVSTHYCFQVKKCRDDTCMYCSINPIRDEKLYDEAGYLPEPTPDDTKEHYLPFSEVNGKQLTMDKHRPSAKNNTDFNDDAADLDKQNRDVFKIEKLRDVINCGECHKPRCVYSVKKTDRQQDEFIRQIQEDQGYVCGDSLSNESLFMKLCVNCTTDVETSYYSGKCRHYLPPVCVYCGVQDELLEDNDLYISDLYTKFSVVRPICSRCHANGKMAKTWGTKFLKKRKT